MSNPKSIQEMNAEMDEWRSAVFRPQWIKCAERMPEIGKRVILWRIGPQFTIAKAQEGKLKIHYGELCWHVAPRYFHKDFITHWQPLPEPPNE